nr:ribonuclease H-like domain-containing protein [Tanacetum cinerariifolium]
PVWGVTDALLKSMSYAPVSVALDDHNKYKHGPSQASESDNQERPNAKSSTKTVNTAGQVNTAAPTYADYPNDPLMLDLEDARIFDDAFDDKDKGAEADYNNLETVISVSPIPSTRIHKDHPQEHIIREVNYAVHTRKMAKQNEARLFSFINKQRRTNHKDFKNYLFACFLSQMEPKKVISGLCIVYGFQYQMDVKSAFLYGTIEKEVYVSQPLGFVDLEFLDRVYKMKKALYGLHQAPRAWYETLPTYLLDNGFIRATIDKTLFIKKIKDDILLVQVYVDDIIFSSTKRPDIMFAEAEYIAASNCCGQVLWLQNKLLDYSYNFMQTKIHVDNECAICVVKNPVYHLKTKHIEIRHGIC